jgi:hypothetical protein
MRIYNFTTTLLAVSLILVSCQSKATPIKEISSIYTPTATEYVLPTFAPTPTPTPSPIPPTPYMVINSTPQPLVTIPDDVKHFVIEEIFSNFDTASLPGIDKIAQETDGFYITYTHGKVTNFISNGEINENGDVEFYINKDKFCVTYGTVIFYNYSDEFGIEYTPHLSKLTVCRFNQITGNCDLPKARIDINEMSKNNARPGWGTEKGWCLNTEGIGLPEGLSPDVRTGYALPPSKDHPDAKYIWRDDNNTDAPPIQFMLDEYNYNKDDPNTFIEYGEVFIWGKDPITGEVKCPMIEIVKE